MRSPPPYCVFFFFNDTATTEIYTLSLHDALPIYDHRLHDRQPVLLHEHVLRSAEPDALRTVLTRLGGVARIVGVGPDLETPDPVSPAQDRVRLRMLAQRLGVDGRHAAEIDVAGEAVDRDLLPFFVGGAVDRERARAQVHHHLAGADDARAAHAARGQGGVASGAACLREDALGLDHAVNVVRVRLHAAQDHRLALLAPLLRSVRVDDGLARGRSPRGAPRSR